LKKGKPIPPSAGYQSEKNRSNEKSLTQILRKSAKDKISSQLAGKIHPKEQDKSCTLLAHKLHLSWFKVALLLFIPKNFNKASLGETGRPTCYHPATTVLPRCSHGALGFYKLLEMVTTPKNSFKTGYTNTKLKENRQPTMKKS